MNENSTLGTCDEKIEKELCSSPEPTKKTLDFIKMFARSYSSKESLQNEIQKVCLN